MFKINLLHVIFILFWIQSHGQSVIISPSNSPELLVNSTNTLQQVVGRLNGRGASFTSLYINNDNPAQNTTIGIGFTRNTSLLSYIGVNGNNDLTFGRTDISFGDIKIRGAGINAGNIGIGLGSIEPSAKLHIDGFTKLGSNAPAIKIKKLTGTTAASEGSQVSIAHGVDDSKILSVSVIVNYSTNDYIPHSYRSVGEYEFEWINVNGNIIVRNISTNSGQILSKPIKILITYEE